MSKKLEIDYDEYQDTVKTIIKQKEIIDKWLNSGKTLIYERTSKTVRLRDEIGEIKYANVPIIREYHSGELQKDIEKFVRLWDDVTKECEQLVYNLRRKQENKKSWWNIS